MRFCGFTAGTATAKFYSYVAGIIILYRNVLENKNRGMAKSLQCFILIFKIIIIGNIYMKIKCKKIFPIHNVFFLVSAQYCSFLEFNRSMY